MFNRRAYMKQWRKDHPEYDKTEYIKRVKYKRKWKKDNADKMKSYRKKWNKKNPGYQKKYQEKYQRKYEKVKYKKEYSEKYRKDNIRKIRKYRREYENMRRKIDLKFKLNSNFTRAVAKSLKGHKNGRRWEILVGYSCNDLIKHLRKTMPKGYCWNDYLQGKLHVDHKIPKSVFNFSKPEHADFKKCWALKNLQLLPANENLVKHNKLQKPFQPSLKIIY